MTLRAYELGFIIPSSVTENDTSEVIGEVQKIVENLDGAVTKVDFWGRRRLAYPILDFNEGYYVFLYMDYPTRNIEELERLLHLNDRVIRHLVVRLDEEVLSTDVVADAEEEDVAEEEVEEAAEPQAAADAETDAEADEAEEEDSEEEAETEEPEVETEE